MRNIRNDILAAATGHAVPYHRGAALKGASQETILAVRKMYDAGEIELTQRRVNDLTFEYRAHRNRKPVARPFEQTFRFAGII